MRDVTERPEGVEVGVVRVVGTERQRIVEGVTQLLDDGDEYDKMATASTLLAMARPAQELWLRYLNGQRSPSGWRMQRYM